ncbi:MAG: ArnT family glycosyltransferase [Pyrinomonadaceae bacterium]
MTTNSRHIQYAKKKLKYFLVGHVPIFLLFFAAAFLLQWVGGAYKADFGGHSDEGAHYVTGLMVRDYVASGHLTSPMRFAEEYYVHYPKVALGHWPPVFYLVQSAWTLPFSPSRTSILLLMAFLTALLAASVCSVIRSDFGIQAGMAAGLLLVSLPLIQLYTNMVMGESLLTLLMFLAVLSFGRYIDTERWQDTVKFGAIASIAILTKQGALSLALVPPIALLLSRRLYLLLRPSFWYPAVIVGLLCGPWYLKTSQMAQQGLPDLVSTHLEGSGWLLRAARFFSWGVVKITGVGLSLLIAAGFIARLVKAYQGMKVGGKWAAAGALILSVLLLQSLVPTDFDPRYLIPTAPALLMFFVAGVAWTSERLPLKGLSLRQKTVALALVAALIYAGETFTIPRKSDHGFTKVAQDLLNKQQFQRSVFMISSDTNGEGAFISEVARMETRPGHVVLRAFKVLSRYRGGRRENIFQTTSQIMDYLDSIPVGILVMNTTPDAMSLEHHQQLMQTVKDFPERWELLGSYPGRVKGGVPPSQVLVYRLVGHEGRPVNKIELDLQHMLNRSLELDQN